MRVIYHPRKKGGDNADQSNDCTGKSPPVAAGASHSNQAGGSGNEKAEIVCVGCDDAGDRQDGDRPAGLAVLVAAAADEAEARAGDDCREKQQERIGTRLLRVLDGAWRDGKQQHQRDAAPERIRPE